MAKKLFPLKMNDFEVRTLEELRNHFDLERVVNYFKSGELLMWLEDRYYDDEAEAIAGIDVDDANRAAKICAALGAETADLDFARRLREKKARLAEMTDDDAIIANAAATALNQEDLATLIQMDCKTIYLCGENFNVPIRVAGVRYVGVLSTPKIKIRAQSQDDLDAQGIAFENVQLPWQKSLPIDELKALAEKIFQTGGKWRLVGSVGGFLGITTSFDTLGKLEQSAILRTICKGKYTEQQIAYLQATMNLSSGFALTVDSFCTGGSIGDNIIRYSDIKHAAISNDTGLTIKTGKQSITFSYSRSSDNPFSNFDKIAQFLETAKKL